MSGRKKHFASGLIVLASVAIVVWLAASHSESFGQAVEGISPLGIGALLFLHLIYAVVNAEIWFDVMKEAEPKITRYSIYSSYGVSSFFWPMSALFGAASQIWALKRIAPESHIGHAISSLAPVVWVKGAVAAIAIAILFGQQSPVNAAAAFGLVALLGVGMFLTEKFTRNRDFFHGLAVIRNPKRMLVIGGLVTAAFVVQIIRLAIALKATGVHTEILPVVSVVIGQGFAGVIPILAGTGSAAVAFSGDQADAAAAVMVCAGTAFIAGAAITLASITWRRKRPVPC